MALIATLVEHPGLARIFFDLRPVEPAPDDEAQIAVAIERAFAEVEAKLPPRAT